MQGAFNLTSNEQRKAWRTFRCFFCAKSLLDLLGWSPELRLRYTDGNGQHAVGMTR
jgi:hypothetical protein